MFSRVRQHRLLASLPVLKAAARSLLALALWLTATRLEAQQPGRGCYVGSPETTIEDLDPGIILLSELNCVACHQAPKALAVALASKSGPLLGGVARRIAPDYLRAFLANPTVEKPGITMPNLLRHMAELEKAETVEALAQFLESLAPGGLQAGTTASALAIQQGRVLYHQVGCVACHAPQEPASALFPSVAGGGLDPDAARFVLDQLSRASAPLGDLCRKTSALALTDFLLEPLKIRPSGRMPAMNLSPDEARSIALYLLQLPSPGAQAAPGREAGAGSSVAGPRAADPAAKPRADRVKSRRGRELFASLGCAACHLLGEKQRAVRPILKAKPFGLLQTNLESGCLSALPLPGGPRFDLTDRQRTALRAVLANAERLLAAPAPGQEAARRLSMFNCYACHSRNGLGGPTPSRSDYFTVLTDADLGDEGRIPPHLTGLGTKLRPEWCREVLVNRGAVRPYMATRMPQYGVAHVEPLVALFETTDRALTPQASAASAQPLETMAASVDIGRELVGAKRYSCISCHSFAGQTSLGISVMDMTHLTRRLQKDWFRRYLLDPAGLRPGTRMPMFWPDGKATITDVLDGNTDRQIEAIWSYLARGWQAPLPPGLAPEGR